MSEIGAHALPEPLAGDVGFLLARAAAGAVRELNQALAPIGLRAKHFALLQLISDGDGVPRAERRSACSVPNPSNVVPLVDELEARGLLVRRPTRTTGAPAAWLITEAGRRALHQALPHATAVQDRLPDGLGSAETDQLLLALNTMVTDRLPYRVHTIGTSSQGGRGRTVQPVDEAVVVRISRARTASSRATAASPHRGARSFPHSRARLDHPAQLRRSIRFVRGEHLLPRHTAVG